MWASLTNTPSLVEEFYLLSSCFWAQWIWNTQETEVKFLNSGPNELKVRTAFWPFGASYVPNQCYDKKEKRKKENG